MATTLEKLLRDMGSVEEAAARRYEAVYDEKRENARQTWEESDRQLVRELGALSQTYDVRRADTAALTRDALHRTGNAALSRGMQRSSYVSQSLANVERTGLEALSSLNREQARQETDVNARRSELKTGYAQKLEALDAQQKSETLAYADELKMKLYDYERELRKEADDYARWMAEFEARYGRKPR